MSAKDIRSSPVLTVNGDKEKDKSERRRFRRGHNKNKADTEITTGSVLALDLVSPRGPSASSSLGSLHPTTFISTFKKCVDIDEESVSPMDEYFSSALRDLFVGMGLNSKQQYEMFFILDSTLSVDQHQRLVDNGPLSMAGSERLRAMIKNTEKVLLAQKGVQKLIKAQALIRCWLVRKKYNSERGRLSQVKQRNDTFLQLVSMEVSFAQRLNSVIQGYLKPMRKNQLKGVDAGSIAQVFSNIEDLYEIHSKLSKDIQALPGVPFNPFFKGIADVFLKYSDQLLPQYENYVENYHIALDTLDVLCKIPKFNAFLEEQRTQRGTDMMSFRDKLGLPLQHLPAWDLMLSEILQCSTPGISNYDNLVNAVTIISNVTSIVQTKLDASATAAKIISVQRRVESDAPLNLLGNPKRKLLREGPVSKVDDKKNAHMFLFNDLILFAEQTSSGNLKFYDRMDITKDVRLTDNTQDKTKFAFHIQTGTKEIKVILKTGPEKASWMADIVTLIHEYQTRCIFGVSLSSIVETEQRKIPKLCELTINYLKANALDIEGIFRVPGDATMILELKAAFDNEESDQIDFDKYSVHDVGGTLKLFFREFPNPLFPFSFFDKLLELYGIYEKQGNVTDSFLEEYAKIISVLPVPNRNLLKYLISFLHTTSQNSEVNKMTTQNLAVVFAPNIIRPKEDTIQTALLSPQVSKLLSILIENHKPSFWKSVRKYVEIGVVIDIEKISTPKMKLKLVTTDSPAVPKRKTKSREKRTASVAMATTSRSTGRTKDDSEAPHLRDLGGPQTISMQQLVKQAPKRNKSKSTIHSPRKSS